MIGLQNHVQQNTSISLNNYIYNSINIFKYNSREIEDYVKTICAENPLIVIDPSNMVLDNTAVQTDYQASFISEMMNHFRCTLTPDDFHVMLFLIRSLEPKGFLKISPDTVQTETDAALEKINHLTEQLKAYENRGIGCKDALDYIAFQLNTANQWNASLFNLFSSHLSDIYNNNFSFLKDMPDISEREFKAYIEHIKQFCDLSPLSGDTVPEIYPDAEITFINGVPEIKMNDYLLNQIRFEPVKTGTSFDDKSAGYKRQYDELVSLLNAKKMYLSQVLSIITDTQYDYLSGKTNFLLTLDQSALSEQTGLSHATISRLICNKYVLTPRGVKLVKSLLSKKCTKGWSVSHVKYLIRSISDFETLSDNKISKHLSEQGVSISRRTVNKYKHQILNG